MYSHMNTNQLSREILHNKVDSFKNEGAFQKSILDKTHTTGVPLAGNGCILENKLAMYYN